MSVDKETAARMNAAKKNAKEVIAVRRRNPRQALRPLKHSVADELPRLTGQPQKRPDVSGISPTNPFTGDKISGKRHVSMAEIMGFDKD
tara:strand:+ start:41 stop:307 length:267 start_codon:yes stop_codon:yes gene_type:complete